MNSLLEVCTESDKKKHDTERFCLHETESATWWGSQPAHIMSGKVTEWLPALDARP